MRDVTTYRAIENSSGTIQLSDLWFNNKWQCEPALHFKEAIAESFWDNADYVLSLFRALKKNKQTKKVKELKQFCKNNNFNYQETVEELLEIYEQSKIMKFWKKR